MLIHVGMMSLHVCLVQRLKDCYIIWYMYIERIVGGYTVIVKTLETHVYSAELHVHITEY